MTGMRKRLAQALVATIVLCGLAFMVCAFFSGQGNVWERACIVLMLLMLGAMFGALGLVAATYLMLRGRVAAYLRRPPLTDEEFAVRMADAGVDRDVMRQVRALAARSFRGLGGERFYPEDRLEDDLHLPDLAPFAIKSFCAELEQSLDLQPDEIRARVALRKLTTFQDVIVCAWAHAGEASAGVPLAEAEPPGV